MNKLIKLYPVLIYIFLYLPIIVLIAFSFNSAKYSTVWHSFTLDWYKHLFSNTSLVSATKNSLLIATLSASLATIIGTIGAVGFYNYKFIGRKVFSSITYVMAIYPDIIMGISLLVLFKFLHLKLGFYTVLLAHITFNIPFIVVIVHSGLKCFNKNLINAARDLGATDFTIFWKIILPLIWQSVASGWLIAFTLSLDDVVVSSFVTGPDFDVLPLTLLSMAKLGIKPQINALCSVLFIITLILVFISHFLFRKKS